MHMYTTHVWLYTWRLLNTPGTLLVAHFREGLANPGYLDHHQVFEEEHNAIHTRTTQDTPPHWLQTERRPFGSVFRGRSVLEQHTKVYLIYRDLFIQRTHSYLPKRNKKSQREENALHFLLSHNSNDGCCAITNSVNSG